MSQAKAKHSTLSMTLTLDSSTSSSSSRQHLITLHLSRASQCSLLPLPLLFHFFSSPQSLFDCCCFPQRDKQLMASSTSFPYSLYLSLPLYIYLFSMTANKLPAYIYIVVSVCPEVQVHSSICASL